MNSFDNIEEEFDINAFVDSLEIIEAYQCDALDSLYYLNQTFEGEIHEY